LSGVCIDKLPHSCGTKKGLQVFADTETGKVNGFCFSCKTFVANPYGEEKTIENVTLPKAKTEKEIQAEIAEVSGFPVLDASSRKLRAKHLDLFGIKISVSEEDGSTPQAMYFPMHKNGKLTGYYVKTLSSPKYTWAIGDVKGVEPFGWQRARKSGAYKLIITEGLEDAVAVEAVFDRHGKEEYHPAVISLPNGVNSVRNSLTQIADEAGRIFKEIVLCFDNDKAGQEAVEEAMLIFPNALSVTLPEKDANDCILKGATNAAFKALSFHAAKPKNTRIIIADESFHELAREPTPFGELTWPYPTMNKLLRNIRFGETVYIGAGVKMGKSELLNDIAGHFIKAHNIPVLLAKPEESNKKSYKLMCNKMVGKVFHDPEVEFDYEAFDKAGKMLQGKLLMIDLYQHLGWDTLKKDITIAARAFGVKAVFIDPITNLTNGMNAADANTKLQEIAQELSAMALDLNIVIFIFVHLKAPEGNITKEARIKKYNENQYIKLGNCPHEYGGDVLSAQFAGSRAMMRSCNLMIGLEGNKDPELPDNIRNMRWLTILEDREFGNNATVPLYWNRNTTLFTEVKS
jgi:twinkle protein